MSRVIAVRGMVMTELDGFEGLEVRGYAEAIAAAGVPGANPHVSLEERSARFADKVRAEQRAIGNWFEEPDEPQPAVLPETQAPAG